MLKKWMAGILSATMLLSLAACTKPGDVRGNVTSKDATGDTGESVSTQAPVEDDQGPEFSTGTSSGNRYENAFIGIGCELDSDWIFMTDEEIQQQNQAGMEIAGEEYQELLENAETISDMMATNVNETDTVNVSLEKLSGVARLIGEDVYVEQGMENLDGVMESMGLENVTTETGEMEFAGSTHKTISTEAELMGVKMYQKQVCVKCSGYMAIVSVCTWQENTTDQILANFFAL